RAVFRAEIRVVDVPVDLIRRHSGIILLHPQLMRFHPDADQVIGLQHLNRLFFRQPHVSAFWLLPLVAQALWPVLIRPKLSIPRQSELGPMVSSDLSPPASLPQSPTSSPPQSIPAPPLPQNISAIRPDSPHPTRSRYSLSDTPPTSPLAIPVSVP